MTDQRLSSMSGTDLTHLIKDTVEHCQYDQLTTKSISYILTFALGYHGHDIRKISLELLHDFERWYKTNQNDRYVPTNGTEPMYGQKYLNLMISYVEHIDENMITTDGAQNRKFAVYELHQMWVMIDHMTYIDTHMSCGGNKTGISQFFSSIWSFFT